MNRRKTIGIVGSGVIAGALIEAFGHGGNVGISFVLVREPGKAEALGLAPGIVIDDAEAALRRPVDLVVEAAVPDVVTNLAPRFLAHSDFCGFSCTALAAPETERAIRTACDASGHGFFVPHGAVIALDGLADGREVLESVTVTTTKSGRSLGISDDAEGIVFEGPTREACTLFPRNVNVHAAIAIAGIGFDRTLSRIVARPGQATMEHRIEVAGTGLAWDIRVSSRSLGGVTGAYTPRSAVGSVQRILGGGGLTVV